MRGFVLIALLVVATTVQAQPTGNLPAALEGIGIEERLGGEIPRELPFLNEDGQEVLLGSFFDGEKPVLLNMVYHECPTLCSLMLTEFTKTLIVLREEAGWRPGEQFDVVTVSFSATEVPDMAARAKARYLNQLGAEDAADGWHFLTGSDASIDGLAEALGFSYRWVEESSEYAHPAALMFLSGSGVITRYIHGMAYDPTDTRLAVVEASEGRIGSAMDRIFLFCYRYDSQANSYVADAWNLMRAGGVLTLLLLGAGLFMYWRRERRALATSLGT